MQDEKDEGEFIHITVYSLTGATRKILIKISNNKL